MNLCGGERESLDVLIAGSIKTLAVAKTGVFQYSKARNKVTFSKQILRLAVKQEKVFSSSQKRRQN